MPESATLPGAPERPRPGDDRTGSDGLVVIVSTVKATVAATERQVGRNLSAGADHVVLFVDDADPEVCAHWEGNPHVTAVPTDAAYWNDNRPPELARRQGINANLVNLALTMVPGATWLFSLDDDECLHIERDRLLALEESVRVVRLTTWEAASLRDTATPGPRLYKRQPDTSELEMLVLLGALDEPQIGHYFRGHRRKIGVRPDRRIRMFLHHAENMKGRRVPMHRDPDALRVLHDESPTIDEFIRKWSAHVGGGGFHASKERQVIRRIFLALEENRAASAQGRRAAYERLYERVARDDVDLLDALGLLVVPEERLHAHEPLTFSPDDRDRMTAMLGAMRLIDKSLLSHIPRPRPVQALRQAHRHLPADSALADEVRAALPSKKAAPAPSGEAG